MVKRKITLSLEEDLIKWGRKYVQTELKYSSVSHLIEMLLDQEKKDNTKPAET